MNVLGLCAGIGGLELGLTVATRGAARTVCLVEREAFCCSVLAARMQSGHLHPAPIWTDLKTFDALPWRGKVDCITAGYPCQPFSDAGKKRGKEDPRHLWPYIADIVATIKPAAVFCENVPGHITLGFQEVCEDLSGMGYSVEAGLFSAQECGAAHRRKRLFFLAYTDSAILRHAESLDWESGLQAQLRNNGAQSPMANANSLQKPQEQRPFGAFGGRTPHGCAKTASRSSQSGLGVSAHGISALVGHIARGWTGDWEQPAERTTINSKHRTDSLRALGNAVVPQTAALAWETLSKEAWP